ncbi:MAG: hypothetical protein RLZ98_602 [Pseudomonadota bacterium]|jgi:hypothetical protein
MARNKMKARAEFVWFNVTYEDGTQTSNRKVPAEILGGLDGDEPAREVIEAQDREIELRSGRKRGAIKLVERVRGK